MPNSKRNKASKQARTSKANGAQALARPMQGIDQKHFRLNDIVPVTLSNPGNDEAYTIIISADVNGYSWTAQDQTGVVTDAGTNLYGALTGQFATQSLFYTQYYTSSVSVDLSLSQGGNVYSMSPLVTLNNPQGSDPFTFGTGGGTFQSLLSAPRETQIHQPYMRNASSLSYKRWLMAMSDRCWRQTRTITAGNVRELYPTNSASVSDPNELFKLPSVTKVFQVTIPQNTFAASSGTFVVGLLKFSVDYVFSQRRLDINDLLAEATDKIRQEERARLKRELLAEDVDQKKK